ncbi:hypothetical protein [Candidatus Ichthyocystis sparus]|uniref:hypothetical protein n=1 Tax=Candidatus Ichthyocystis sparus TaxID=1561004 RepID=UPI000B848298|nr:hypothetical protein [Candidatus Ichthyocystis sparus]
MWNKKLLVIYDYRICLTRLYVLLVTEYNVVILKQAQFKYQIRRKKAAQETLTQIIYYARYKISDMSTVDSIIALCM